MLASSLNRRAFLGGLGCLSVAGRVPLSLGGGPILGVRRVRASAASGLGLPAIAAPVLPETLVIGDPADGIAMRAGKDFLATLAEAGCVEFRRYSFIPQLEKIFQDRGILPLLTGARGEFLFGFESLAHREKVWREFGVQREWRLQELAIYRGAGPDLPDL